MRQPRDEAEDHQGVIIGRQSTGDVAQRKKRHQHQQEMASIEMRAHDGDQGRANDHPQRIGADDVADLRLRNLQRLGHVGHQPHDGKFADPDGKATYGQR